MVLTNTSMRRHKHALPICDTNSDTNSYSCRRTNFLQSETELCFCSLINYWALQWLRRVPDCILLLSHAQVAVQAQIKTNFFSRICTWFTYQPWLHSLRKLLFKSIYIIPFHHQLWTIFKFHLEENQKLFWQMSPKLEPCQATQKSSPQSSLVK